MSAVIIALRMAVLAEKPGGGRAEDGLRLQEAAFVSVFGFKRESEPITEKGVRKNS